MCNSRRGESRRRGLCLDGTPHLRGELGNAVGRGGRGNWRRALQAPPPFWAPGREAAAASISGRHQGLAVSRGRALGGPRNFRAGSRSPGLPGPLPRGRWAWRRAQGRRYRRPAQPPARRPARSRPRAGLPPTLTVHGGEILGRGNGRGVPWTAGSRTRAPRSVPARPRRPRSR